MNIVKILSEKVDSLIYEPTRQELRGMLVKHSLDTRKEEFKIWFKDKFKKYMKDYISISKFKTLHRKYQLLDTRYNKLNKQHLLSLKKLDGYIDKNTELKNKIKELKEENKLLKQRKVIT